MNVSVKCPYCGCIKNTMRATGPHTTRKLITCETEEGGCDQEFVAEVQLEAIVKTKKIEGAVTK